MVASVAVAQEDAPTTSDLKYDKKSKVLIQAPILVEKVKGDVRVTTADVPGSTPLESGTTLRQGCTIKTGDKSRVDLIFSNGAVLALESNTELIIDQFLQAGGYDISPPIGGGKGVIDQQVPTIGSIDKEPTYSFTKVYLRNGELYGRVKKLHKKSDYIVQTPLGRSKILGTTWRESVTTDQRDALKKQVQILLQEGLIQYKPIDSTTEINEPVMVEPQHQVTVTGTFATFEALNQALSLALEVKVEVDIAVVQELIRDPEFYDLITNYLPEDRGEQITAINPVNPDDGGFFGGDQGVSTVGGTGGGGGGSGGNPDPTPTPNPTPTPDPTPPVS